MRTGKQIQTIKPLPYPAYLIPILLLAAAGLAISIYLSISHYRNYTDIGYKSFCAISRAINCDTVSQSRYAIFAGAPLPVWGCVAYGVFIFLLVVQIRSNTRERLWPALFLVALLFSLHSVFLALISTVYIKSYCLMCILDYAVNFALLFMIWIIRKRFDPDSLLAGVKKDIAFISGQRRNVYGFLGVTLGAAFTLSLFFPAYWEFTVPTMNAKTRTGETGEGHPWIGSATPEIIIEEYTDYQCFQCRKMHFFLRKLIAQYPDRIRLVHRHFPMDHRVNPLVKEPFHVGSGAMAVLSIYAMEQGRFWEFNDMLFEWAATEKELNTGDIAARFNFDPQAFAASLNSREKLQTLRRDIIEGLKLGITGTPAYQIDGDVYQGHIPPDVLKRFID
ncbi:MAG: vitamin K epoxide reductase family protein [Desulfobacterales bacterium]|jgi:uncharacterized membrane protein/protein-disulfide isomerase